MTFQFEYSPAHAVMPMIRAHGNGIVFSTVFHENGEHGLQLIHVPDGETVDIALTEEYRVGKVYSVFLSPFDAEEWLYRYRCGDRFVVDPHAFSVRKALIREEGREKTIAACSCAPVRADGFFPGAPERPLPPADWTKQVIYGLHVKGFTAQLPEAQDLRGTFAGVISRIPYLKDLGITAVELMPVYRPLPGLRKKKTFRTMQEALGAWPVGPQGDPLRDMKERPNYWGFGRGLYFALRPEFGSQKDFALMVHALHEAGIRVLLQIFFEKGVTAAEQLFVLRYYIDRFGIDGFRLLGNVELASSLASAPSLADTALLCSSFPFREFEDQEEAERLLYEEDIDSLFGCAQTEEGHPGTGPAGPGFPVRIAAQSGAASREQASFPALITCGEDFQTLLRRFVKSDDYVLKDFLKLFLSVPEEHGFLRSVTGYEGFTLADLVSYSERHNQANGEFGLDGRADNYSWNCGEEGPSDDPQVLALRRKQVRNFLTLLLLAQGTPMLRQGDERCNSQEGNNNPYCQDNEISWIDWTEDPEKKALTAFTARLIAFRKDHPVFRSRRPFQYIDYRGMGHPDVSLHGEEAWKPDLGEFSHSVGIAFCENYAQEMQDQDRRRANQPLSFTYVALNMYWKELSLALPKLPPHYVWKVFMDTAAEEGFLDLPLTPADQHSVDVAPRSIRLLRAVPDIDSILRERKKEKLRTLPPVWAVRRDLKRGKGGRSGKKYPRRVLRLINLPAADRSR